MHKRWQRSIRLIKDALIFRLTGLSGSTPDLVLNTDNCSVTESVSDFYSFDIDFLNKKSMHAH